MILRIMGLLLGLALVGTVCSAVDAPVLPCVIPEVAVVDKVEFIALTPFAEIIGATAIEDVLTGVVTLTRGAHRFTCAAGKKTASDGTHEITLPVAPVAQGELLYAPLQAMVTALGGQEVMDFDVSKGSARVKFPDRTSTDKFPRHPLSTIDDLRHANADLYVSHPDGSALHRLSYSFADSNKRALALSPDGLSVLYIRDGGIVLHALDSHREAVLLLGDREKGYFAHDCCFASDGQSIIFSGFHNGGMSISRMDLDGQHLRPLIQQGGQFTLLPAGKGIAYATGGRWNTAGALLLADADGANPHKIPMTGTRVFSLRCSNNGALLVANLQYYVPATYQMVMKTSIMSYALTGDNAGKTYEIPAEQRNAQMPEKSVEDVSADGQFILYSIHSTFNRKNSYWLMRYDLSDERQLPLPADAQQLRFSPDGHSLLFMRGDATFAMAPDTFAISPSPPVPALLTKDGAYALFLR